MLAGNLAPAEVFLGWKEWERPIRPGSFEKDHLIGLGTKLPGATMVAAQSVIAMRETQQVILNAFNTHPDQAFRVRDLHELLGMPTDDPAMNVTRSRLGRQGFLTQPGRGRYQKRT